MPTASPGPAAPRVASSGRTHSATRETLLRLIEAQSAPITIAHLATMSGCHENTVRGHLHALWRDGFIGRQLAPAAGQGRPAWRWHVAMPATVPDSLSSPGSLGSLSSPGSPGTLSSPGSPYSHYAGLAIALAEGLAATGAKAPHHARAVGEQWGRTLAATLPPATTPAEARRTILAVMRDQGFAPHAVSASGAPASPGSPDSPASSSAPDSPASPNVPAFPSSPASPGGDRACAHSSTDGSTNDNTDNTDNTVGDSEYGIKLKHCPLLAAAARRPDIVCAVHLGMVAGALEGIGAPDAGSTIAPMSGPGECTLTLRVRS